MVSVVKKLKFELKLADLIHFSILHVSIHLQSRVDENIVEYDTSVE